MDNAQPILLILQLVVLVIVLMVALNIRRRMRHHERVLDKLMQRQKRVRSQLDSIVEKSAKYRAREKQEGGQDGLLEMHRALADQITHAGEHLDRRIGDLEGRLAGGVVGASEAPPEVNRESPQVTESDPDAEVKIAREGVKIAPERNLNLIHAIPKTGNSSLLATLWASKRIADSAISAHFYSAAAMEDIKEMSTSIMSVKGRQGAERQYLRASATREFLGQMGYLADWPGYDSLPVPSHKLNVICAFREPVAAAMSLRFYVRSLGGPQDSSQVMQLKGRCKQVPLGSDFPFHPEDYLEWMNQWVAHELESLYGIKLTEVPVDHSKGYGIYETDRVRLLVVTTESFGHLEDSLAEFYGASRSDIELVKANDGESRDDAAAYREAVESYQASDRMLDRLYSAPILNHLYSKAQLEAFKEKWSV